MNRGRLVFSCPSVTPLFRQLESTAEATAYAAPRQWVRLENLLMTTPPIIKITDALEFECPICGYRSRAKGHADQSANHMIQEHSYKLQSIAQHPHENAAGTWFETVIYVALEG